MQCMQYTHSACLVPRFFTSERVGQSFFAGLETGIVTNQKQKIPSQVFIALSECRSHQLH